MEDHRPSRPVRSQRRTRNESVSLKQPELLQSRENSLDSLDDGTFREINSMSSIIADISFLLPHRRSQARQK